MIEFNRTLRRRASKRVATDDGRGFTSVPDGFVVGEVSLVIDGEAILKRLGEKVLYNKTGRAVALGGLIKVRATNVRRER